MPESIVRTLNALVRSAGLNRTRIVEEMILRHDSAIPLSLGERRFAELIDTEDARSASVQAPLSVHVNRIVIDRLDHATSEHGLNRSAAIRAIITRALASI